MNNIEHEMTEEIVCPFCGSEFTESWEFGEYSNDEDLGLVECDECNKSFYATRNISISYSTKKAKYGTCNHCHSKNLVVEDYLSSLGKYKNLCISCGCKEKQRLHKKYIEELNQEKHEI